MRFPIASVVKCSGRGCRCLVVLLLLLAGLQAMAGVNDEFRKVEPISPGDIETLQGVFTLRFSSASMIGQAFFSSETVKTVYGVLSHGMVTDLSDDTMDDLFALGENTRLSLGSPLALQQADNKGSVRISTNLNIQQNGATELPLVMDGHFGIGSDESYVFNVTGLSIPVVWVPGQEMTEFTAPDEGGTRQVIWRGRELRYFMAGMPGRPMSYHSTQQLHIPFTPIPKPILPKASPLPDSQGVFPEDSKHSPFPTTPDLEKPADEPDFTSEGVSFPSHHSPFS